MASTPTNTYSKNFTSSNQPPSGTCGIPDSALNGVSGRYIVTITATGGTSFIKQGSAAVAGGIAGGIAAIGGVTGNLIGSVAGVAVNNSLTASNRGGQNEFTIYAFLQDKIILNAHSDWEGVTQGMPGLGSGVATFGNAVEFGTQSVLGRTSITPLSTRRKWAGSKPISMNMKLKFESFSDPYREVLYPCIGLQGLTLPRGGVGNTFGLIPPGPSPFDISLKGEPSSERTENISLNIGDFLKFPSVIISDVRVSFENRMSAKGPIGAEVDLTIETYQMLTREDLMNISKTTGLIQGNLGPQGSITGIGT